MADAGNFVHLYSAQINNLINLLADLEGMNQQLTDDPTLLTRFSELQVGNPNYRGDITETDITNAQDALVQILFAYTSGSPTQQSFLNKMVP